MQLLKYELKVLGFFYLTQYLKNCMFPVSQGSFQSLTNSNSISTQYSEFTMTGQRVLIYPIVFIPKLSNDKPAYYIILSLAKGSNLSCSPEIGDDHKRTSSCTLACLCHSPCNEKILFFFRLQIQWYDIYSVRTMRYMSSVASPLATPWTED